MINITNEIKSIQSVMASCLQQDADMTEEEITKLNHTALGES